MTLFAALPAGVLAAGEESGGVPTPGETATESPAGTAEPAPSSPGSAGWTPVGTDTGASSGGAAPIRRGSSLGSGGGSEHAGSTGEKKAGSTHEEPSYVTGSGSDYEPESSTPSIVKEAASTPQAESTSRTEPRPPPIDKAARVALGTAIPVALPKAPQGDDASPAPAPFTDSGDQATSGSDASPSLAMIVLGLLLIYAGGLLGLRLWRRRAQRRQLEVYRSRDADWQAALLQIELTRAPVSPNPNGKQLRHIEVGSDSAPLETGTGGTAGQDRARGKPAKAR